MKNYDLAVIGAGPGGYISAIRASSLGLKTIIIEKDPFPGGTCLNRGCIPTKVLCHISERFKEASKYSSIGIIAKDISLDIKAIQKRKNGVVLQLQKSLVSLMSRKDIDLANGEAEILDNNNIKIKGFHSKEITANNILLATGSKPAVPPSWETDSDILMTSDEILNFNKIPETLLIIGGGVIGMEFASIFSSFGSKVTVVEAMPSILPLEDKDIVSAIQRVYERRKVDFYTATEVEEIKKVNGSIQVSFKEASGKTFEKNYEAALIAVGRMPVLDGLEKLNLEQKENHIKVNEFYETSVPGIFAVGDLVGKTGLAHGASAEGIIAAEKIAGLKPRPLNYNAVPGCIYTDPEIARVGLTEEKAREIHGDNVATESYPIRGVGKSMVSNQMDGMVKIIIEKKYKEILGISLMGANVTEMIAGFALGLNVESTLEDLSNTVFPHPSLSEMVMECAKKLDGAGIHC